MTTPAALRSRVRLLAACVLLTGLAMVQSPGLLVADTKLDLALNPGGFLLRATHLWDPLGAFGQLQNQAYGYLWPMGPFFLLGEVIDLPGWVVQRLWLALVLCVALVGTARLARALGIRSDLGCLLAGFAFALSPRMLTTLGPISIEAWPSALAPWVLLPLVVGAQRGSPRRAALLSALAVAMVGGVNAAATLAVLPLGALWLLTRTPGPRRRALMVWWPVFTILATCWWLVPLVVMGSYSPPFLDYIEAASNTTFPTTLFDALRGTSDWVAYIDTSSRAGNDLLRQFFLVVNSGVVLMFGLVGLMLPRTPNRLFLALGVVTGLGLVTMGHLGSVQGWLALDQRHLLDEALAPLRNVHKFDVVLRLPLVLGLGWMVDAVLVRDGSRTEHAANHPTVASALLARANRTVLTATAVIAVFGAALPVATGRVTPSGGMPDVPRYWSQAARWLGHEPGAALLVPGSSFGSYVWGSPHDEPFQALASSRWAVRNAVPLAPPGNIRMMDAVERRLAQGLGSPGLTAYLRRAGVTHLLVRNDLARSGDVPDPVLVHQAIADSPGLVRVASFGPVIGGQAHLEGKTGRVLVNGGWQNEYDAIEIFAVAGGVSFAVGSDVLPVVVGGPEDLLDLTDLGVLKDEPTRLAVDVHGPLDGNAPLVLTDGLRTVEQNFGRVHDGVSSTRAPGEPRRMGNRVLDYLPADAARWTTSARYEGAAGVSASSSMSDADAVGGAQPGQQPYAALDGDPGTSWVANYRVNEPAWWQVDFTNTQSLDQVTVTAGSRDREVIRLRTQDRVSPVVTLQPGESRTIRLDDRGARWLRIEDASERAGHRLSLAEVAIPGVRVTRSLVLPRLPAAWGDPDQVVLRAVTDARTGCVDVDAAVRCIPDRAVVGEEPDGFRRTVTLNAPQTYRAQVRARVRTGNALVRELLRDQPIGISASTVGNPDVRGSAVAAVDGDPGTTWTAALSDLRPVLRMNWLGKQTISGLDIAVADNTDARAPERLSLEWPGGTRNVTVPPSGQVRLRPFRTDQLTVSVLEARPATSLDFDSHASVVPVGISELRLRGLPYLPVTLPRKQMSRPCGSGPGVTVDGVELRTAVRASAAELYSGNAVIARPCGAGAVSLTQGQNSIEASSSALFAPTSVVLSRGGSPVAEPRALGVRASGPVRRVITPDGESTTLSVKENANPGWQASQGGHRLESLVVDGWQQGWQLRSGAGPVTAHFVPDRVYRVGMVAGLLLLVALVALAAASRRRWARGADPLDAAQAPAVALAAISVLGGGLLAGSWGAVLAGAAHAVAVLLHRRMPGEAPWLLAAVVLPAVAAYAVEPWGGTSGWAGDLAWPHYLVVVACGCLFGSLSTARVRLPRLASRIPGRSTRR